jgi:multiple sugar transport system substrate-binding protein
VTAADFSAGNAAFSTMLASDYRKYSKYPESVEKYTDFQWSTVNMPAGPAGDNVSETDLVSAAVSERSTHKKAAFEFLKIISADKEIQKDVLKYSDALPVVKSVIQDEAEEDKVIDYKMLDEVLDNAYVINEFDHYQDAIKLMDAKVSGAFDDHENLKAALSGAHSDVNELMSGY